MAEIRYGSISRARPANPGGNQPLLCLETQSRQIMAVLVNDVVADALRLGLYDKPAERIVKANGAPLTAHGRMR